MRWTPLCALAASLALPATAGAHPHVWATVETEVLYNDSQMVTGLLHRWTFDEFYSAFAVQGLAADGGNSPTRAELQPLATENVESLAEFDYFTFLTVDGRTAGLEEPEDYWLEHVDGLLVLHFTLPLETPVNARLGDVAFSVYDPTYFVAFSLAEDEPVRLASAAPDSCRPEVSAPEEAETDSDALSEAFYEALGPDSDFGATLAAEVAIDCTTR